MPAVPKPASPLVLVWGEDDFSVQRRARELFEKWSEEIGGLDHEIIDGRALNAGEAIKALRRLREALQTLPFFGTGKAVWLRDCTFLGDDRPATSQAVTDALAALAAELKVFPFQNVRLLISAGAVDRRRAFFKTVEKLGTVEAHGAWSTSDRNWADQAATLVRREARARGKEIADRAVGELVARVGPVPRTLVSELEKAALHAGGRAEITDGDIEAVCLQNKFARAFALGDALGNRDLPGLLRCLDQELWEIRLKLDREKSEFGLLYGLINKVRALLQLKSMLAEGWLTPTAQYDDFKAQLGRVPADRLPADRRYNPLAVNPYMLFKALPQTANYTQEELIRAMERLLRCNLRLVTSSLDETLVLQETLVQIAGRGEGAPGAPARRETGRN